MTKLCLLCNDPISALSDSDYCADCRARPDIIEAIENSEHRNVYLESRQMLVNILRREPQTVAIEDVDPENSRIAGEPDIPFEQGSLRHFLEAFDEMIIAVENAEQQLSKRELYALVEQNIASFQESYNGQRHLSQREQAEVFNDVMRKRGLQVARDAGDFRDLVFQAKKKLRKPKDKKRIEVS